MALRALSEINGAVKEECPLDQERISATVESLGVCPRASTRPLSHSPCPDHQHQVNLSQLFHRGALVPGPTTAAPPHLIFSLN